MGFRYRKSVNLGGGFRINVSKNGVGYSWGVKGARVTKTAKGTTRKTLSIPGTGVSYVEETSSKNKRATKTYENNKPIYQHDSDILSNTNLNNINVESYKSAEYKELLDAIHNIQKINKISTVLIWTILLSAFPIFLLTGLLGIIIKIYVHTKMPISMDYELDEESKIVYDKLTNIWTSLNNNNHLWQVMESAKFTNSRVYGGAQNGVTLTLIKATSKIPFFIKLNFTPFGLQLGKNQLLFLPDKLLVIDDNKVGAINYSDIDINFSKTSFVETGIIPSDAKILRQTWLKVNKDGSPDKRYKDNRQVPVCEYGQIEISSGNSLYVKIMCSNSETVDKMEPYAKKLVGKDAS